MPRKSDEMKVLIVNTSDIEGGAARAAFRLYRSLRVIGVDASMFVQKKTGRDLHVYGGRTKLEKGFAQIRPALDALPLCVYKNRRPVYFSPSWIPTNTAIGRINSSDADVVHLHWVCGGFLRPSDIAKIRKPIVWSLHDNWAFTGGCHLIWDCEKYLTHCGACPILGSSINRDLSYYQFEQKLKYYPRSNIRSIVCLSKWLEDRAKASKIFEGFDIRCLPNPIDTNVYSPLSQELARSLLRLSPDKKLIAFGAMSATSDVNKGFGKLIDALSRLHLDDVELVVFGAEAPETAPDFGFPAHYIGQLYDDLSLRVVYSAADVVVVPSLQENLSNVIMESLSCGTPVVAFNAGGNSDLISHLKNGYLAERFDSDDLAKGVRWVLDHPEVDDIKANARNGVLEHFEMKHVAERYYRLYSEVLGRG